MSNCDLHVLKFYNISINDNRPLKMNFVGQGIFFHKFLFKNGCENEFKGKYEK